MFKLKSASNYSQKIYHKDNLKNITKLPFYATSKGEISNLIKTLLI